MMSKNKDNRVLIFVRRIQKESEYLFLKFTETPKAQLQRQTLSELNETNNLIRGIKGISVQARFNYRIMIANLR